MEEDKIKANKVKKDNKECDFIEQNPISQNERIYNNFKNRLDSSVVEKSQQELVLQILKEVQDE